MNYILFFLMISVSPVKVNAESNTDILPCNLTGQLLSTLGINQDAFRREFKHFTNLIEKSMEAFKEKLEADMKIKDSRATSIVYTRWGKKTCPYGAELVLSGFTGGSWYNDRGAAVESLCLPKDPQWGVYRDGVNKYRAYVFGAEYETDTFAGYMTSLYQHDVPCAVCLTRGMSVVKMFPARRTCYRGWKLEYRGYLMAGFYGYHSGTQYTCIDSHADAVHGGHSDKNGRLFYPVEARCGSLKCPPYVEGRELTCVVCSKE